MKTPWLPRLLATLILLLAAWGTLCAVILTFYSLGWLPTRAQHAALAGASIARADWRRQERREARRNVAAERTSPTRPEARWATSPAPTP